MLLSARDGITVVCNRSGSASMPGACAAARRSAAGPAQVTWGKRSRRRSLTMLSTRVRNCGRLERIAVQPRLESTFRLLSGKTAILPDSTSPGNGLTGAGGVLVAGFAQPATKSSSSSKNLRYGIERKKEGEEGRRKREE